MGFIGKVFKGIGKIASGVMKFAQSPFGKLLFNVGLSFVTGGAGGLFSKALGMLGKAGSITKLFGGFADKFLGPAQSFLSKSGLGGIAGFLKNAGGPGDLLKMAQGIFQARKPQPPADVDTNAAIEHNLKQLFAKRQAEQYLAQQQAA